MAALAERYRAVQRTDAQAILAGETIAPIAAPAAIAPELLELALQRGYQTSLAAAWFGAGPDEFGFPGIQLRLDTSSKAENVPPPKVGDMIAMEGKRTMSSEDFTALWDGITASLRVRPGAF